MKMNKSRYWIITYEQEFRGEILKDSYKAYGTYYEMEERVERLYSDPHIISVSIEDVE